MQPLFAGETFSNVMTARLQQMKTEIEKLKCADVEIGEAELAGKAEKIAEKFIASDIPTLDQAALEKTSDDGSGKQTWQIPFSGGEKYFSYSLSEQQTQYTVDKIAGNRLFINIEIDADAEKRAEETLIVIQKLLVSMRQEAAANFSAEKLKEAALATLKRKRDSCARLRAGGYAVR